MSIVLSFDFDKETAKILEELSQEMGISEEEVIKIDIKLYEEKRESKQS